MSTPDDHSDDIALAGEYVLHLLGDAERAAFEARMQDEPRLRDLVRNWDERLVVLADDVQPVTPPSGVKARVQRTLFPNAHRHRNSVWAWLSGGLTAAVLVFAVVLLMPTLTREFAPEPSLTASVAAEDGTLLVRASYIAETNVLELSRESGGAVPGRVLELWLIAEGAAAPVSLGVLPQDPQARITLPPAIAQQLANATLAISDEPIGGSPTGVPTGDVLAAGQVTDA